MKQLAGKQTQIIDAEFVEIKKRTSDDLRARLEKAENDRFTCLWVIVSLVLGGITTAILAFIARWQWEVLPVLTICSLFWLGTTGRLFILYEHYRSRKGRQSWTTGTRALSTRRK